MKKFTTFFAVLVAFALSILLSTGTGVDTMKTLTIHTLSGEEANYDVTEQRMGVMVLDRRDLYTIEKPWLPNEAASDRIGGGIPFHSAVPLGEYDLVMRESPTKGWQWHLVNPDLHVYLEKGDCPDINPETGEPDISRYSCMFHVANYVADVVGCIGPGLSLWASPHGLAVGNSGDALLQIKQYLDGATAARLRIV